MKSLALLVVLVGLMSMAGGCLFATPAYSAEERTRLIDRTTGYNWAQAQDDWDSLWLLRPPSNMTIWNVR